MRIIRRNFHHIAACFCLKLFFADILALGFRTDDITHGNGIHHSVGEGTAVGQIRPDGRFLLAAKMYPQNA